MEKLRKYNFVFLIIFFLIYQLIIVWRQKLFLGQDSMGHLATAWIVSNINKVKLYKEFFEIKITPVPNLFIHLLLPFLIKIFSPEVALKIVISLYIFLFQLALFLLLKSQKNGLKFFIISLANILVFNHFLFKGNLNFCFSLPLFLTGIYIFENCITKKIKLLYYYLFHLLLYFTHLFGYLAYTVFITISLIIKLFKKELNIKKNIYIFIPIILTGVIIIIYIFTNKSATVTFSPIKLVNSIFSSSAMKIKSDSIWWTFLSFDLEKEKEIYKPFYISFWIFIFLIIILNIKKFYLDEKIMAVLSLLISYFLHPVEVSFIVRPYERILPFVYLTGIYTFISIRLDKNKKIIPKIIRISGTIISFFLLIQNIKYFSYIDKLQKDSNKIYNFIEESVNYIPSHSKVYILINYNTMIGKINLFLHSFNCIVWKKNSITSDIFADVGEILRWEEGKNLVLPPSKIPDAESLKKYDIVYVWGINFTIHKYLTLNNFNLLFARKIIGIYGRR